MSDLTDWADALNAVADELERLEDEQARIEFERAREANNRLFIHLRNWGVFDRTTGDDDATK